MSISLRGLILGIVIVVGALALGGTLGTMSVPSYESEIRRTAVNPRAVEQGEDALPVDARMRFQVSLQPGAILPAVREQMQLARNAGIADFIFSINLPYSDEERAELRLTISSLVVPGSNDRFWLGVNCDPPNAWYLTNPDHVALGTEDARQPSVSSPLWIESTKSELSALLELFVDENAESALAGVILHALRDGNWAQLDTIDSSVHNTKSFRLWLQGKYLGIEELSAMWGIEPLESWDHIEIPIPESPDTDALLNPTSQRARIDYNEFISQMTATSIRELTTHLRATNVGELEILANTMNVFQDSRPNSGQYTHSELTDDELDGITTTSPTRTLSGFASTAPLNDLEIIHMDEFFTGITFDEFTESARVPANYDRTMLRQDMSRNATISALTRGTWAISDPAGQGTFTYEHLWRDIAQLAEVRKQVFDADSNASMTPLTLVYDASWSHYAGNHEFLNTMTLDAIDAVVRSGLPHTWAKIDDVLAAPENSQPIYIFLNLFGATEQEQKSLQAAFVSQQATAIWLYAPGVIREIVSHENIVALSGVDVEQRPSDQSLGSKFAFTGSWIEENQEYGNASSGITSYRVVDQAADPLARYQDNDDTSAAMKFHESGWTSIVLLDPAVTPEFLKDLVFVLGTQVDVLVHAESGAPILARVGDILVAHAEDESEIRIEINEPRSVLNLADASEAWYERSDIVIVLSPGDTKVLHFQHPDHTP